MSSASDTALHNFMVKPASEAQHHEVLLRNAAHWGAKAGVDVDTYLQLSTIFEAGEYARDGKLTTWVLVPKHDPETTNFFASCQTFSRKVAVLYPGKASPTSEVGHAISVVLTPPTHQGKGHATRLTSLLHVALAPQRYPESQALVTPTPLESSVSVLYSSIGHFYSRCVPPSTSEPGWTAPPSFKTVWSLSDLEAPIDDANSSTTPIATVSDVATTLTSDDDNIITDLLERQKSDPSCTYFAFTDSASLNGFPLTLSTLHPATPQDVPWGARIPNSSDFITWVYTGSFSVLSVTRLRATSDSFPLLLRAARRAAEQAGCKSIEVWNVPEHLADIVALTGGNTVEKDDNLSAFKWCGKEPEGNSKVVWVLDERYAWC